jgi:hypothetical protein
MKMILVVIPLLVILGNHEANARRSSKDPQPGGSAEERLQQSYERAQIRRQAAMETAQEIRKQNRQRIQQNRKSKGLPPLPDHDRDPHHPNEPKNRPSNK